MLIGAPAFSQDTVRIAAFHVGLKRDGPGLLLRDILNRGDPRILMVQNVIVAANPDVVLLTRFDFDLGQHALTAFADFLAEAGVDYPYLFSRAPNSGVASGLDLDGDGYLGGARDAVGYGAFAGHGGMALLSKFPIDADGARDFTAFEWRDLPGATLPEGTPASQRLSSVGHWDVPVIMPDGARLHLLAYHATTPAFDGPEDRNGLRNRDETLFWLRYLEGGLSVQPAGGAFVILGDANLDPLDGDGRRQAIRTLLNSGFVQDPEPRSARGTAAAAAQGGVNVDQRGDPALDTADWKDTDGPGNLRVDYVLPSVALQVVGAGVQWPAPGDGDDALGHGLVWVDIRR